MSMRHHLYHLGGRSCITIHTMLRPERPYPQRVPFRLPAARALLPSRCLLVQTGVDEANSRAVFPEGPRPAR